MNNNAQTTRIYNIYIFFVIEFIGNTENLINKNFNGIAKDGRYGLNPVWHKEYIGLFKKLEQSISNCDIKTMQFFISLTQIIFKVSAMEKFKISEGIYDKQTI